MQERGKKMEESVRTDKNNRYGGLYVQKIVIYLKTTLEIAQKWKALMWFS